ncbi:MAG: ribonuclease Z [Desulfobacteraceae bacterium]|nr:MAG: ribonuclease Z [Desulfobacteraceae bacterium]
MTEKAGLAVTILGSGTCVPSLRRSSCSVLVEINGTKLLFDSGPGTLRRMLRTGTTIFDISYIFYSHRHPDHTSELVPFLFATKYPNSTRRLEPLTIIAGRGFSSFYRGLQSVYGSWIDIGERLRVLEMSNTGKDNRRFDGFEVHSIPVEHLDESIAFRITGSNGKTVVYSGDSDVCENLVEIAERADLFICESAFPDESKVQGHLTPSRAGMIASRARVGKLVLTHLYPECDSADIEKECRKTYNGPLVLAEDLMRFEL